MKLTIARLKSLIREEFSRMGDTNIFAFIVLFIMNLCFKEN
jgi:hypothetical protein